MGTPMASPTNMVMETLHTALVNMAGIDPALLNNPLD